METGSVLNRGRPVKPHSPLTPPKPLKTKPQRPPPQLQIDSPHRVTLKTLKAKPQLRRAQAVSTSLHAEARSRQPVEGCAVALERGIHGWHLPLRSAEALEHLDNGARSQCRHRAALDDLALGIAGGGTLAQL